MRFYFQILVVIFCFALIACNRKFDRNDWLQGGEGYYYPYRRAMLKDLTTNYKLKGLTYKQLVGLLGNDDKSMRDTNTNEICYPVYIHWDMIDPDHSINLTFKLNNDSIVTDFKIEEWEK